MGRSTQTLKTDLQHPVLRSRSMWCYVRFDTARSQQSCQIRIKTPACRVDTKWFTDIRNESRSRAPSGVLQSCVYLARKFYVCVQTLGCRWPCMICVREIMMIRRDYHGRVVCWWLCPLSNDQVWGRCHQASARPRASTVGGRLADGIPSQEVPGNACYKLRKYHQSFLQHPWPHPWGDRHCQVPGGKHSSQVKLESSHPEGYIQGKFNLCFPSEKHPSMSSWNQGAVLKDPSMISYRIC